MDFELDWLLKLRLAVARFGEMDSARWWNTDGQLGPRGASVLRRGFPRTHHFAQARSVFAAATARCGEVFGQGSAETLWWLGEDIEEAFDLQWEVWLDNAGAWTPFFEALAQPTADDLVAILQSFGVVSERQVASLAGRHVDPGDRSLQVADAFDGEGDTVAMLALGYAKGRQGHLVVPFAVSAA